MYDGRLGFDIRSRRKAAALDVSVSSRFFRGFSEHDLIPSRLCNEFLSAWFKNRLRNT